MAVWRLYETPLKFDQWSYESRFFYGFEYSLILGGFKLNNIRSFNGHTIFGVRSGARCFQNQRFDQYQVECRYIACLAAVRWFEQGAPA